MNAMTQEMTQVHSLTIEGRIEDARRTESAHYTVLRAPASDPYSYPPIYEIRSERQLGRKGDVVSVLCQLKGFLGRPYTDKTTGEINRKVQLLLEAC